ncbi:hypothetical protein D9758_008130 [Tetrapyrgos nigripes]|uniref:Checkpoint protein RAD24-like helical bundle domain-containing protein n=1 Tax=Tetrapyrgos nigripes TaxID=182062 RepID=A0A8H5GHM7_9AGAR|nr:hypothetical protein D9758_008130 [Tetrapyrgos nigripes]
MDERKRKLTLEKARAAHLSKQLQLRLQYARLKVEHGWHKQNLNEVENLYFHHTNARSPEINTQTSSQGAHPGSHKPFVSHVFAETLLSLRTESSGSRSSPPEAKFRPSANEETARSGTPVLVESASNLAASASTSSSRITGTHLQPTGSNVQLLASNSYSRPTAMDVDQNPPRPSTPNNPVSLAAAARAYPSPSYNPPPALSHNLPGSSINDHEKPNSTKPPSKPRRTSAASNKNSAASASPSTSTSSPTAPSTSKSGPVPLSSLSSFSWSSSESQNSSSQPGSTNFTYDYNTGKTTTPVPVPKPTPQAVMPTPTPTPTLTYDSFWSSHSATKAVRASFSGFSGKNTPSSSTTGSTSSLGTTGSMSSAVGAALSLLQRRASEGQFGNGAGVDLGPPFDAPKVSNSVLVGTNSGPGLRGIEGVASGSASARVPAAERASSAVGAVGVFELRQHNEDKCDCGSCDSNRAWSRHASSTWTMPKPASTTKSKPTSKATTKTTRKTSTHTLKLESSETASTSKRFDPLTAFAKPSQSQTPEQRLSLSQLSNHTPSHKGKAKELPVNDGDASGNPYFERLFFCRAEHIPDDRLWVDMYEPQDEKTLAVHFKKVQDVRDWLNEAFMGGPTGKMRRYRRILVLTGPAGTAKTTTIRVLSREMQFEIVEWRNALDDAPYSFNGFAKTDENYASSSLQPWPSRDENSETSFAKFQTFLMRAARCSNVFSSPLKVEESKDTRSSSPSSSSTMVNPPARRLILLEDLPNILHLSTRTHFHEAIQSVLNSGMNEPDPIPIVIILSDSGTRGEADDERLANGMWSKDRDGVMDIRTLLPKEILQGPYVTQIRFNPVAPTLLTKALKALLDKRFPKDSGSRSPISAALLDVIVNSANGDIRSAIMGLQFACTRLTKPTKSKAKKASDGTKLNEQVLVESITRREQSLVLFHLLGKVLYNKRKGDPPAASTSARDARKEQELDKRLKDPPKLPPHLSEHDRKASRVDINMLYSDSPIDSSLFSLYIHQNYPQFCDEINHCEDVSEWLSWIDSSGGEAWYQANPHQFHLLALGTLHSLPHPIERRGQKTFKPEFFDALEKEKTAWEGVKDVRSWIVDQGIRSSRGTAASFSFDTEHEEDDAGWNISGWTHRNIAIELGGVLKARDTARIISPNQYSSTSSMVPRNHRVFSSMQFTYPSGSGSDFGSTMRTEQVDDTEDGREPYSDGAIPLEEQQEMGMLQDGEVWEKKLEINEGGWLESDDIDDFPD